MNFSKWCPKHKKLSKRQPKMLNDCRECHAPVRYCHFACSFSKKQTCLFLFSFWNSVYPLFFDCTPLLKICSNKMGSSCGHQIISVPNLLYQLIN